MRPETQVLLDAATPLPWEAWLREGCDAGHDLDLMATGISDRDREDAALIVHAVNRLPDYEATRRRHSLRTAVDALERLGSLRARLSMPVSRSAARRSRT